MSDRTDSPTPASADAPTQRAIENPMLAWVKGGTRTSASEKEIATRFAASEHARSVADREKQLASVPVEAGGAKMHTRDLRGPMGATYAYCTFVSKYGEEYTDGIVDVGLDDNGVMYLMVICPKCFRDHGLHADQSQLKISSDNKKFDMVPCTPYFKPFNDGFGWQQYRISATIKASEKFKCARCEWVARFDKDRIIED